MGYPTNAQKYQWAAKERKAKRVKRKAENNNKKSNGMPLGGVLLVIFVVLKLTGLITWSWWWVLSPIWIAFLIAAVALTILWSIVAYKAVKEYKR